MTFKAILFDLDGTLLDTLDDLADSANGALRQLRFPEHPRDRFRYFIGDGIENLARRALPPDHRDSSTVARCGELMRGEYSARWADKTRPYPGIPELLDALTVRNVPMAVLSNKPDQFTQLCVSRLLPDWRFACVLGSSAQLPRKPDPTGAQEIAKRLGTAPEDFLYLGDTDTDMQTAVAAGMFPVGALWGFRTADELMANGARALLNVPAELLGLIEECQR